MPRNVCHRRMWCACNSITSMHPGTGCGAIPIALHKGWNWAPARHTHPKPCQPTSLVLLASGTGVCWLCLQHYMWGKRSLCPLRVRRWATSKSPRAVGKEGRGDGPPMGKSQVPAPQTTLQGPNRLGHDSTEHGPGGGIQENDQDRRALGLGGGQAGGQRY